MSENKNRTVEEIQQEYGNVCAAIGEKGFQLKVLEADIQKGHARILELGKEMSKAQEKAARKEQPLAFTQPQDLAQTPAVEATDEAKN